MVSIDTHPDHAFAWVDLAARDVDASVAFYAGLFGWTTFTAEGSPYTIFLAGDRPAAGVMELTAEMGEMPQVWSVYVSVADADATASDITQAGGSVLQPPFELPDGGRIAVVADPAGAVFCLFEGNNDNGLKVMDEVGAPCWFDCMSRQPEVSQAFYETVFGWTSEAMEMGEMTYIVLARDGEPTGGVMPMPPTVPAEVPSHWVISFVVADADAAAAYVESEGGTITLPPMVTPFGRSCGVIDPWGASLTLIDRSSATENV